MTNAEKQVAALGRAREGQSFSNYPVIIRGFMEKGIPEADIRPRENVFTYEAWRAVGRQVRKGEHGVRVHTFLSLPETRNDETGEVERPASRRPWTTTVFHISQTDERS